MPLNTLKGCSALKKPVNGGFPEEIGVEAVSVNFVPIKLLPLPPRWLTRLSNKIPFQIVIPKSASQEWIIVSILTATPVIILFGGIPLMFIVSYDD